MIPASYSTNFYPTNFPEFAGSYLDLHFERSKMICLLKNIALMFYWLIATIFFTCRADAALLTAGFFSGQIDQYDLLGGAKTTFATVASAGDPFPGLAGIAINPTNNQVFVSARVSNRIYSFNGSTGAPVGFHQLPSGSSPAGLTFSSTGTLYVSNFGTNTVNSFNVANNSLFSTVNSLTIPNALPSGVAFDNSGRLLISTFGGLGVLASNASLSTPTTFASEVNANGQIAVDAQGNVYVGSAATSSNVFKFSSTGSPVGNPWLTLALPTPPQPFASPDLTSPSGVAIDPNGNIIVGALGQTNPTSASDSFQSNGGLFRFSPNAAQLFSFGTGTTPYSSLAISPIPEPTSFLLVLATMLTGSLVQRTRKLE